MKRQIHPLSEEFIYGSPELYRFHRNRIEQLPRTGRTVERKIEDEEKGDVESRVR
jgi:hypothetical protein